jgi:hypothetical protein
MKIWQKLDNTKLFKRKREGIEVLICSVKYSLYFYRGKLCDRVMKTEQKPHCTSELLRRHTRDIQTAAASYKVGGVVLMTFINLRDAL